MTGETSSSIFHSAIGPRGKFSEGLFVMAARPPAEIGMPAEAVDTPALVLDLDILDRNLKRMADTADRAGVCLRPHAKSHKCPMIARKQMALGAVGVCCQKVSEAEAMVEGGVPDVLVDLRNRRRTQGAAPCRPRPPRAGRRDRRSSGPGGGVQPRRRRIRGHPHRHGGHLRWRPAHRRGAREAGR